MYAGRNNVTLLLKLIVVTSDYFHPVAAEGGAGIWHVGLAGGWRPEVRPLGLEPSLEQRTELWLPVEAGPPRYRHLQ